MAVQKADGSPVTKVGLNKTPYVADDELFTINEELFQVKPLPGSTETNRRRLARAGEIVRQSDIDRWFTGP